MMMALLQVHTHSANLLLSGGVKGELVASTQSVTGSQDPERYRASRATMSCMVLVRLIEGDHKMIVSRILVHPVSGVMVAVYL